VIAKETDKKTKNIQHQNLLVFEALLFDRLNRPGGPVCNI
jgi:hypothetical protein